MGALIDLTGQKFGLLTVHKRLGDRTLPSGARQPMWGCICACGRRSAEEGRALRAGRAKTCRSCVRDPARTLRYGRVYVIVFPKAGVLKIGWRTSARRLIELQAAGGILIDEYRDVDKSWERVGREALAELFPPAFTSRQEAENVLPRGAGWTDCFRLAPRDIDLALHAILRAGIERGNDFGQNPPATPIWRQTLAGVQRARRSARGRRADDARAAGADRLGDTASVGPRVDRTRAVPGRPAGDVDRPCDPRRPGARGGRSRALLGAERPRVARPDLTEAPGATRAIFNGLGERERGREGESAGARSRGRETARTGQNRAGGPRGRGDLDTLGHRALAPHRCSSPGTSCTAARTSAGMPGSPRGDLRGVRAVRYSDHTSEDVPRSTEVRAAALSVRGAAVGGVRQ